ncbi:MAG: hypothetical protein H6Q17_2576 [Bacteroidetes bacterium]|nr:hypothetical protein [Bacteroidota bacterium]
MKAALDFRERLFYVPGSVYFEVIFDSTSTVSCQDRYETAVNKKRGNPCGDASFDLNAVKPA